jgi:hypothetical protein
VLPFASSNFACDESHLLSPDSAAHHATLGNTNEADRLRKVFSVKNEGCRTEKRAIFHTYTDTYFAEQLLFKKIPVWVYFLMLVLRNSLELIF